MTNKNQSVDPISFASAFKYWLKLGFISFGGPAGQISMMHQELVEKKRWISEKRFFHALNYTMVLPGPEAQQLATYIGWLMHGNIGGLIAGGLFILPSILILMLLSYLYLSFGNITVVAEILNVIKPSVTAIVIFSAIRIGKKTCRNKVLVLYAVVAFFMLSYFKTPFPYIVVLAGLSGYLLSKRLPKIFLQESQTVKEDKHEKTIIDDDTPLPEHAKYKLSKILIASITGMSLWAIGFFTFYFVYGWSHDLTQMGWFFTKAALFTFGGAYAVLPYVYDGGVLKYGWLSGGQMMDGLALGETTPGPLIMVVAFVGFVGGWNKEVLGPELIGIGGVYACLVVIFFTFLPSFLFILIGAPAVEATRENINFTGPLTGITAAVVGVILNLAYFFGTHILFPENSLESFNWFAAVLVLVSLALLYYAKISIMKLIGLCALLGILKTGIHYLVS